MTVDYPDWQTSEKRALEIWNQTVPLGRKPVNVANNTGTIAASTVLDLFTAETVVQPSFQIILFLQQTSAASTIPVGRMRITWIDSTSGFSGLTDTLFLPAGFGGNTVYLITGPCRMDECSIDLSNLDPANFLGYDYSFTQHSNVLTALRVEELENQAIPQLTRGGSFPQAGVLCSTNANVPASGNITRLACVWAGEAYLYTDNSSGEDPCLVQLIDIGVALGTGALMGTPTSGIIASYIAPLSGTNGAVVALPPGGVCIKHTNQGAGAAITPTTTLVRKDF